MTRSAPRSSRPASNWTSTTPHRQTVRYRLLIEDARLLPRQFARLQLRARPHALGAHRRQSRQPRLDLPGRVRRRRTASIGIGQFAHVHAARRQHDYIVKNNGVYGLTKGQFSATADKGSKAKRGVVNTDQPIDLCDGAATRRDLRRPQLLRRQGAARAADQGGHRAKGRGLHRRASAPASRSTTTPARPRASTMCANTTRR